MIFSKHKKRQILLNKNPLIAQKLNSIFMRIEFLPDMPATPILAVTSPNKGEGKTFFLNNYGYQLVKNQKKVLLIDTDFYSPELSRLYKVRKFKGLTDYIVKDLPLEEVVNSLIANRLEIISVGTQAPNYIDLLKSPKFVELLSLLRDQYDYILVDCPPLKIFPDAQITSQFTDRTIIVSNPYKTTNSDLKFSSDLLGSIDKLAGVVINQKKYDRKELKNYQYY